MNTKLILRVDSDLIIKAKRLARKREDGHNFLMQSVSPSVLLKSQRIKNISVGSGTAVEIKGWLLKQPKHPIPAAARSNLI